VGSDFLPADVKIETLAGIIIAISGALMNIKPFQPIDGSALMNKM